MQRCPVPLNILYHSIALPSGIRSIFSIIPSQPCRQRFLHNATLGERNQIQMRCEGAKTPSAALCRNQTLRNLRTENFTGMDRMNRISL
jgi:hypothetical protein